MTPRHQGVCITDLTNSWTCVMIVRDLVVLILDVVVALIQGDFVVFVRGSSKYAGKGQPLNLSISLTDTTNIVATPRQKAKSIWGKL